MKQTRFLFTAAVAGLLVITGCKSAAPIRSVSPSEAVASPKPNPPPAPIDPNRAFRRGAQAFEEGRFPDAANDFEQAWSESKNPLAAYNRGLSHERLGQLTDAERAYRDASRAAPTHEPSRAGLARILRIQGKARNAVELYEEAIRAPGGNENGKLFSGLAVALHADKRNAEAEVAARKALARNRDDAQAYQALASIYLEQNRYRLAELTLAAALKLNDKDPASVNTLGLVYLKQGDRERALVQFKRAASLDGGFVPAYRNWGALALGYRDYGAAQKALGQAATLDSANPDAQLFYGQALDGQKGSDPKKGLEAGSAFERALALRPNLPEALCGAGWAYAADPQGYEKARGYLEQCNARASLSKQERQAVELKLKALQAPPPSAPPPPK